MVSIVRARAELLRNGQIQDRGSRKLSPVAVFSKRSLLNTQCALKERRRRRAEKWLSKRVFLESPFLLCPLKVCP